MSQSPSKDANLNTSANREPNQSYDLDELSQQFEQRLRENDLENAKQILSDASERAPQHFTLWAHKLALYENNMSKAIQSFIELHSESMQNGAFQSYVIEIACHVGDDSDHKLSKLFANLSPLYQRAVLDYAADHYRQDGDNYRACCILLQYIQSYPKLSVQYLLPVARSLIQCETSQSLTPSPDNMYRAKFVTQLLPHLYKYTVCFAGKENDATIDTVEGKSIITIPYDEFTKFLRLAQGYYIYLRDWTTLSDFSTSMMRSCGYNGLKISYDEMSTNYFTDLRQSRQALHITQRASNNRKVNKGPILSPEEIRTHAAFACETSIIAAQLAKTGFEYFNHVCVTHENATNPEEKACLIPICILPDNNSTVPSAQKNGENSSADTQSTLSSVPYRNSLTVENHHTEADNLNGVQDGEIASKNVDSDNDDSNYGTSGKRGRPAASENNDKPKGVMKLSNLIHDSTPTPAKRQKTEKSPETDKPTDCLKGAHEALACLKNGAACLEYLESMWKDLSLNKDVIIPEWEDELNKVIEFFDLPFDIYNSIILMRSDIALSAASTPGNLAKALKLSQSLCDRIEIQRSKEKAAILTSTVQELDIPFMLAFRVLYNIGIIYLLVGNIQQSTLEIAIILSVFPIARGLTEEDFALDEANCNKAIDTFGNQGFGLMRLTQQALVARCIKHLIVGHDYESEQRGGMASLDAAIRWDEKAGNILVLMQYGWPYWKERTNYWTKIVNRMKEKKTFKNRSFLEYTHLPEILHTLQFLHESGAVRLDIIPPEYSQNSPYHHFSPSSTPSSSVPSSPAATHSPPATPPHSITSSSSGSHTLPSLSSLPLYHAPPPPPPIYQPSSINTILPSMSMSPSWYSASTQKNLHANWMSPSFYYSRPATSVLLPKRGDLLHSSPLYRGDQLEQHQRRQQQQQFQSKDLVSRCIQYRLQKYSPKATPSRMRFVLQKFLKNMVVRANSDA
ncbi:hypothetical protein BGW37DRAFT_517621 [Umbelopsis sp. PMI_123]|nr:hypothetical protein BGW37DRAFT_517621 [Umbelopsis sp. PMI_123]